MMMWDMYAMVLTSLQDLEVKPWWLLTSVFGGIRYWGTVMGVLIRVCYTHSEWLTMDKSSIWANCNADFKGEGDVILKHDIRERAQMTNVLIKERLLLNYGWRMRKPSYQYLRVWGCLAKVAVPPPKAQKIGPKSVDCIFIGYAKKSTAYRFIVHESKNPDIQKNTIMESRNASFFENIFPCLSKETGSSSRLDEKVVQDKRQRNDNDLQDERQDQTDEEEVEPRRSKRARNEKSFGPDFVSFMVENEPTSYREAVTSSEGQQWREAIKSEIESILQNHTWELVDLPPGCKPLGYKWIFKKKMKADGTVDKYKARVVIQGFRQREGLDYFDTYSPVTRITSIRMIIAIAALRNLEIHQMDVKTAFLNGDLEEEIYMNQPEGFIAPGQEGKDTSSGYVILCLYVDDMLIVGSNDKIIRSTKDMLKSKFDMKDMGLADVILGIKIIRTQNGLVLSQAHYVDKILNTHNAGDSGQARTPIDTSMHLSKNRGLGVAQLEYSRIIGMLIHPAVIEGYSDANWISDIKDSRSTSGYVFTLGGAAISWKSSKQTVIAKSTMESEFIALDKCGEEAEWLRQFVEDIPRWPKPVTAISIHCDSKSAMGRAKSTMYNGKSRHIRRRHNSIRQLLSTGVISIDYVASKDNIADPFTKGLSRELVSKLSSPAVQRLWTLYPGNRRRICFKGIVFPTALTQSGIRTFSHDYDLPSGSDITKEIPKAIQVSRVFIIVFSKEYVSSSQCLDELVRIVDSKGQLVLPVYYNIDLSKLHQETETFIGCGLVEYDVDIKKAEIWHAALTHVANLSGWDLQNISKGHEAKFIQEIVRYVHNIVKRNRLHVAKYPVGLECRVEDMSSLVNIGSNEVRIVGIYGMGGISKTTIAKAFYNSTFHLFEGSCFLANVREVCEQPNGLVHLQEQLLSEILQGLKQKVANEHIGISFLKERLCHKRVLIILDDLDQLSQLDRLAGQCQWFGLGSRIIITTRDENFLSQAKVDHRYEAKALNDHDSLRLFSWHAFRKPNPVKTYEDLSEGIVHYTTGLPLALEVLGASLYGRTKRKLWVSTLKKLKNIPPYQVLEKLRISFDTLDDATIKNIFLDIACFFIGMDKDYASNIFEGCGFFPGIGINILIERCLLRIGHSNKLRMHDLVRDMGKGVVHKNICYKNHVELGFREPPTTNASEYQNVCDYAEVKLVALDMQYNHLKTWNGVKFLTNLSISSLIQDNKRVAWQNSNKATYDKSDVSGSPLIPLSTTPLSKIEGTLNCETMFLHSHFFSKCKSRIEGYRCFNDRTGKYTILPMSVHAYVVKKRSSIVVYGVAGTSLGTYEESILKSELKMPTLKLWLPDILLATSSSGSVHAFLLGLAVDQRSKRSSTFLGSIIPDTVSDALDSAHHVLHNAVSPRVKSYAVIHKVERADDSSTSESTSFRLTALNLGYCENLKSLPKSICNLRSLERLYLDECSNLDKLPEEVGNIESLQELHATGTAIKQLPDSIGHLKKLKNVSLAQSNKRHMKAKHWFSFFPFQILSQTRTEIKFLPPTFSTLSSIKDMDLSDINLSDVDISYDLSQLSSLRYLHLNGNNFSSLPSSLNQLCYNQLANSLLMIARREIPDWFNHQKDGSYISSDVPSGVESDFLKMIIWVDYINEGRYEVGLEAVIKNKTHDTEWTYEASFFRTREVNSWVSNGPQPYSIRSGDTIEVYIVGDDGLKVEKCGIHLAYRQDTEGTTQHSQAMVKIQSKNEDDLIHKKRSNAAAVTTHDSSYENNASKRMKLEVK
ncbi:retrovirus-related pol polyprotein from transposon TNT 1-94 [Tanacetum coccineum]|uniref:Retrovirus-related pol polyprotein from transposon TNT 1-94 n=1 Tax=Tanacetum coccineum TaxID=301880 RepID=A0ABQ5E5A9_9ASTR